MPEGFKPNERAKREPAPPPLERGKDGKRAATPRVAKSLTSSVDALMNPMNTFRLSLRMFARDWRAGELRLIVAALAIAVGAVTTVGFFGDRVLRGVSYQSAELLGADLVLVSPRPAPVEWLAGAQNFGLRRAEATEFSSVVVKGEQLQLASVRAVSADYPLRGTLRASQALFGNDVPVHELPAAGTAWVEPRALLSLQAVVGDRIEIGAAQFTVTRVLTFEPGRGGNFFGIAPRVLIRTEDVARTGVIQPGSRITYAYGFAGVESAVARYREWVKPKLESTQQVLDAREGNNTIASAVERVQRYLGLTSLLAVLLAGVAIAMAARRYSERHFDTSALLRSFGATEREVAAIHLGQLFVLALGASTAGVALGGFAQAALNYLLRDFFPMPLPAPGPLPAVLGLVTGFVTLAGFAVAPVLRLRRVPPLRVLRRELVPLPASAWVVYGSAAIAMLVLMWRYTGNWTLTLAVLGGATGAAAALGLIAWLLVNLSRRMQRRTGGFWRQGIANLSRRGRASVGQVLAFGLTLMAMAVIALVRTDLLATWQRQLLADAPNHFAFNILPGDVTAMERFFAANDIRSQALYPMVRGRLVAIDGVAVAQAVTKEEGNNEALQRELNLSWTAVLPPDNAIVRGAWWSGRGDAAVSVEEKLAKKLGIEPGAELTFSIGGAELKSRVAGTRKVQWDSFHPNFFMIFSPGVLDSFPATYITSFHLPPAKKPLLNTLVRAFPAVTVIEVDQVMAQVRTILAQVTFAVEFVLLFVLAAGFAVLYAALAASLDERLHEGAILRTFGASRRRLRAGNLAEFAVLGALAGVLAAVGTELVAYFTYSRAFDLEYSVKWPVWLIAPVAGAVSIGFAGYVGTRRVADQSPLAVLREL
jgi:putative ABC transport system permease protein